MDIADVGMRSWASSLRLLKHLHAVDGLLAANVGFGAALSPSFVPHPRLRRLVLVASWEADEAIDRFVATDAGHALADGWSIRGSVLRASGSWPGLDTGTPVSRHVSYDGPVAVLTLGRLKASRAIPFFRASARAEGQILSSPGLIWGTGIGLPPFVGTCSLWTDSRAVFGFAYQDPHSPHSAAMNADSQQSFHHQSAFIRLRPHAVSGTLNDPNPLTIEQTKRLNVPTSNQMSLGGAQPTQ